MNAHFVDLASNRREFGGRFALLFLLLLIAVMTGCQKTPETPPSPTPTVTPTFTGTPTPPPSPTPAPPTSTPTPVTLSPAQIFERIAPSVAFIDTKVGSGSGFLIEDGYVVTNAHVVWPFDKVRVVFPGGLEFKEVPVVGMDLIADLAVIGPVEVDLPPLHPIDGETYVIGSEVFLIGYPGEVDAFPQPSISRGLISRKREWKAGKLTYFQTDATIAGGQSGGVLVSNRGEVIGISSLSFAERQFGLVASAADIMPRVAGLIAGEKVDGLGRQPHYRQLHGERSSKVALSGGWDMATFVLLPEEGDKVHLELDGPSSMFFWVISAVGEPLRDERDPMAIMVQELEAHVAEIPYYVIVFDDFGRPVHGRLTASHPLRALYDPDDQRPKRILGQTLVGAMDHPGDLDVYPLYLKEGDTIHVRIESVMIDPMGFVNLAEYPQDEDLAGDDNSGKGVFGTVAEFSFRAPGDDFYAILVQDNQQRRIGGYYLTVESYQEKGPTPIAPTPTPTPIPTDVGEMAVYTHETPPRYTIHYPAQWRRIYDPLTCLETSECFGNTDSMVAFHNIPKDDSASSLSLEKLAELLRKQLELQNIQIVEEREYTNPQGHTFRIMHIYNPEFFKHSWIIMTRIQQRLVMIVFSTTDIQAMLAQGEKVSADQLFDQYEGGIEAFEAMVMHALDSFQELK